MFASWKKAGNASLVAAATVASLLVAAPSARALEGLQGRHAIFYPSLELVYVHDDNFFLSNGQPGSIPVVSADTFLAHAHFALEIPGARQYLRLEYQPQYRNVNVNHFPGFDLPNNISHFWDLNARLKGSAIFGVDINQHYSLANLETYELDANRGELAVNAGARFQKHDIGVDFKWEGGKQGAVLKLGHLDTNFPDNQTEPWFEENTLRLGMQYFYKFTSLSRFLLGYDFKDTSLDYVSQVQATNGGLPSLDSNTHHAYIGFQEELGRTTTGKATVGFTDLNFDGTTNTHSDFQGLDLSAQVTKSFSRYSKLIFGADRAANFSAFDRNTYYIDNRLAFTFTNQPQGHRLGWTLAGAWQRDDYDTPTGGVLRQDDIKMARAEVGYHPLEHLSFRLNYKYEERESNLDIYEYTDNLIIFQLQFGF